MMLSYLLSRTHEMGWKKEAKKRKKNGAQPIFIRPRDIEILCMKQGCECLIASQVIISSCLFSQNESFFFFHYLWVPYEMQTVITVLVSRIRFDFRL